jgi:hypothetical protein
MAGAYWSQSGRTTTWTNATELEDSTGLHSFAMVDETTAGSRTVTAALSSASASFNFLLVSAS